MTCYHRAKSTTIEAADPPTLSLLDLRDPGLLALMACLLPPPHPVGALAARLQALHQNGGGAGLLLVTDRPLPHLQVLLQPGLAKGYMVSHYFSESGHVGGSACS